MLISETLIPNLFKNHQADSLTQLRFREEVLKECRIRRIHNSKIFLIKKISKDL